MIKLNLLPAHVLERHRIKGFVLVVAALLGLELAALAVLIVSNTKLEKKLTEELAEKTALKDAVEAKQAEAQAKKSQIAPFEATVDFAAKLAGDRDYTPPGTMWAEVLDEVIRFTYDRAQYTRVTLANNGVGIQGQVDTPPAYVRYLMNLERCPALSDIQPSVNLGAGGAVGFSVNCSLTESVETPGLSASSRSSGGYGMGGGMMGPGMGGGMGGGMGPGMGGEGMGSGPPM